LRILFLSFYYPPDLSAGSFRSVALVRALLERLPQDAHIDVITTLPNRYSTFSSEAPVREEHPRLTVHRVALPAHKSGMVDQSKGFLTYARSALALCKGKRYDLVYATSGRLLSASLGALLARRHGAPLYLDIRDIFVDTMKDVLPRKMAWAIKPLLSALERWTVGSARRVNLVSPGFLPYFEARYPGRDWALFSNGIDEEFLLDVEPASAQLDPPPTSERVLDVVYAGNMGEGQGLHAILPALARRFQGRLHFRLVGDGGRRAQLEQALTDAGCDNVTLLDPVKRTELIELYRAADVLFLHLNDYPAFKKVLPSKLFEYAALGKPVWAGVGGYAARFVEEHIDNAAVFAPCDVDDAARAFEALNPVTRARPDFVARFRRDVIMARMSRDVLSIPGDTQNKETD
jgi:glycosyltransferase involved in cell wall biosynthesis